jgi:hypothetical protein
MTEGCIIRPLVDCSAAMGACLRLYLHWLIYYETERYYDRNHGVPRNTFSKMMRWCWYKVWIVFLLILDLLVTCFFVNCTGKRFSSFLFDPFILWGKKNYRREVDASRFQACHCQTWWHSFTDNFWKTKIWLGLLQSQLCCSF